MTVIYYMSIDRADKPWIGDRRFTELDAQGRAVPPACHLLLRAGLVKWSPRIDLCPGSRSRW